MKNTPKFFILALCAMVACNNNGTAKSERTTDSLASAGDIAFVRLDSLLPAYDKYVDLAAEFETAATKAQKDLQARERGLRNQAASLEEKAQNGLMTRSDIAKEQERLTRNAEYLQVDQQNSMTQLAEQEQVMTNQIMYSIQQYLKVYNADGRFKMILSTSGGTPILNADPRLDITREVIEGLNAEYAKEKKK